MRYTIVVLLISGILKCMAQNLTDEHGLKVGMWEEEEFSLYGESVVNKGIYRVVPLKEYKIVEKVSDQSYKIRYGSSITFVSVAGRYKGYVSVPDSTWITVDKDSVTRSMLYWKRGVLTANKDFDTTGTLEQFNYTDFVNDTGFRLTYKDGKLFKKGFYPPEEKNQQTIIYYPNNNLVISKAEFNFYARVGETRQDFLELSSRTPMEILSITSTSGNIRFSKKDIPLAISPGDTVKIRLTFTPDPSLFQQEDTLTIQTTEAAYKIYFSLRASHIDGSNIETVKEISLSKTRDRYLLLVSMGTETSAVISKEEEQKRFRINGTKKIDLSSFAVGEYNLGVYSCHVGGDLKLIITE